MMFFVGATFGCSSDEQPASVRTPHDSYEYVARINKPFFKRSFNGRANPSTGFFEQSTKLSSPGPANHDDLLVVRVWTPSLMIRTNTVKSLGSVERCSWPLSREYPQPFAQFDPTQIRNRLRASGARRINVDGGIFDRRLGSPAAITASMDGPNLRVDLLDDDGDVFGDVNFFNFNAPMQIDAPQAKGCNESAGSLSDQGRTSQGLEPDPLE